MVFPDDNLLEPAFNQGFIKFSKVSALLLEESKKEDKSEYVSPYSESVRGKESEITVEADKKSGRNISFYEAFDRFQADNDVNENDEEIFYESVFQEFNKQWQGKREAVSEKKQKSLDRKQ